MKTVCFYPTNQKRTNHFLYNLSNLLESSGKFKCIGYKEIKKECPRQIFSADVYHINWFDQSKDVLSFFKRLYFLLALKLKKKKIVWTIHNVQSHIKTPFYNRILFKLLVRFSDVIHIMCKETVSIAHLEKCMDKVKLIPHGDYYGSYPESDFDIYSHYGIEKTRPVFLFSGAIQPYKNIEILIKSFQKAWNVDETDESVPFLLICGKVEPPSYRESIQRLLVDAKRIVFDPQFIPDENIAAYMKSAMVLITPYSYRSSLNSGTIPLAFSYGKTVVCPDIPCVKDVVAESSCLYSYHYGTEEEHIESLSKMMLQVYSEYKSGKILERQHDAVIYMERNSWKAHENEWTSLYEDAAC